MADLTLDSNRGFLWKCSRDYYARSHVPIPHHFLEAELVDKMLQDGMTAPEEIDEIGQFLDYVYRVDPVGFDSEMALGYAKRLLEEVRVNRPVQEMLQDGHDVSTVFDTFQQGLSAATVSVAEPIDPMANWEQMLGTVKPTPIGGAEISYFNMLVNGGIVPGEIYIMMGPMGGYKTTMAIDVVCSVAKVDHDYTAFLSYEQSYQGGDLPIRFMSRLSGVNRDLLMNNTASNLPEDQVKLMNDAQAYSKYTMFMDRSQAQDKVSDIAAYVREWDRKGCKPKLLVIDQLMTWLQLWPEAANAKDDWFRKTSTQVIKDLKAQICERHGISMLVLHQITAAKISKKKGASFLHTDSAENKGLGFWADFVMTIGIKDDNDVFPVVSGKARRGPNTECLVQAQPETCRFRYASDYEINDTGVIQKKGSGNVCVSAQPIDKSKMTKSQALE